jgi:D-lactate dehydrogenase
MLKLVPDMVGADPAAAGLLIECRGQTAAALGDRIAEVQKALVGAGLPFGPKAATPLPLDAYAFSHDAGVCKTYWDVRKGLIPIVGGAREPGTSMLIEDVACPVDRLADMTVDLADMFERHGYKEASCFGHALEGNLHLVFAQGFRTPAEVQRFSDMMEEMCYIVATKHSGSLKGEHGTGRNIAPFVEMEWGTKAYELMWELKALFDPESVLNPGVILNRVRDGRRRGGWEVFFFFFWARPHPLTLTHTPSPPPVLQDPDVHVKNLKPSPLASPLVDRCIECGFCESNCPSRDAALTPRQRITSYRELARLKSLPDGSRTAVDEERLVALSAAFEYMGKEMCAADGMCQEKCPVKINTGELVKSLRAEDVGNAPRAAALALTLSRHVGGLVAAARPLLSTVDVARKLVGAGTLEAVSGVLNRVSGRAVPTYNAYMPTGAAPLPTPPPASSAADARKVVYLPSCVTRMMGPAGTDPVQSSPPDALLSLCAKAGYDVVYPESVKSLCCGMMFGSKGFDVAASESASRVEAALLAASDNGRHPVVCDTSPCLATLKDKLAAGPLKFALYEPAGFVRHFLEPRLDFTPVRDTVAVHVPCSSKKMGATAEIERLAARAAHTVVPSGVPCCGMAGDRGMRYPELTGGALQHLDTAGCSDG